MSSGSLSDRLADSSTDPRAQLTRLLKCSSNFTVLDCGCHAPVGLFVVSLCCAVHWPGFEGKETNCVIVAPPVVHAGEEVYSCFACRGCYNIAHVSSGGRGFVPIGDF